MKYRDEQFIKADPGCSVDVEYHAGKFRAEVYFDRTLRNGDVQPYQLHLTDLNPGAIRCIARSLNRALDQWSEDWHETKNTLRGDA